MSEFGDNTTAPSETTEGGPKATKESCTGPLKPDPFVKDQEFKDLVAKQGFGKAKPKKIGDNELQGLGLGIYDRADKKNKKFPSDAIEGIFKDDVMRYEDCTKNRIESDQKDGDKIIKEGGYGEEYNLKPVSYIPTAKYIEEKEKLLKDSPLKEEDLTKLKEELTKLEEKGDGKGPDEFLKGMFGTAPNMMEEPNKGVISELLKEYYEFLKKFEGDHKKVDEYYETLVIDDDGKKLSDLYELRDDTEIPNCEDDPFKAIICFAHEKAMIESEKMKGGADDLVVFGNGSRWRRIVVRMMAVFFLICYGLLIYESSRLLMSSINRVLDAREAYYQANPDMREGDEIVGGDGGYMSYLYSIGQVAIEIFGGGLISSIATAQNFAVDQARNAATKIADTAGRTMVNRHSNGVVSFINGFLTGDTQAEATAVAGIERQAEMNRISNEAIKEVNLGFQSIVDDAAFSANGFVTGINGMATSLVILGNTIRPDIYKIEHVTASCVALRGAYSPDKMLKYASTTGNLAILFKAGALPSYQRVPEASTEVVLAEETKDPASEEKPEPEPEQKSSFLSSFFGPSASSSSSSAIKDAEKKEEKKEDSKSSESSEEDIEVTRANIKATKDLQALRGDKKGGKRKTGKKLIDIFGGRKKRKTSKNNKKKKTLKKKSKKGKTKKRKTIKKRRKGKK